MTQSKVAPTQVGFSHVPAGGPGFGQSSEAPKAGAARGREQSPAGSWGGCGRWLWLSSPASSSELPQGSKTIGKVRVRGGCVHAAKKEMVLTQGQSG